MKWVKLIKRYKLPVISPEIVMKKHKNKDMLFEQQPEISKGEKLVEIWRKDVPDSRGSQLV